MQIDAGHTGRASDSTVLIEARDFYLKFYGIQIHLFTYLNRIKLTDHVIVNNTTDAVDTVVIC